MHHFLFDIRSTSARPTAASATICDVVIPLRTVARGLVAPAGRTVSVVWPMGEPRCPWFNVETAFTYTPVCEAQSAVKLGIGTENGPLNQGTPSLVWSSQICAGETPGTSNVYGEPHAIDVTGLLLASKNVGAPYAPKPPYIVPHFESSQTVTRPAAMIAMPITAGELPRSAASAMPAAAVSTKAPAKLSTAAITRCTFCPTWLLVR